MRSKWYSDNRDLVKWSVLLHLATTIEAARILQITFLRLDEFGGITIDGKRLEIPSDVKMHFRDIHNVERSPFGAKVKVFDVVFQERDSYLLQAKAFITSYEKEKCIVFLDPDTGLAPSRPTLKHVLEPEIKEFWTTLKPGDVLALYQHKTNRNGEEWVEPKRKQLQEAIGAEEGAVKVATGFDIASDVAFFYAERK